MTSLTAVLVLGIFTLVLLVILVMGLFRHLKLLGATLKRFNDDVMPVLEKLRDGSARAQGRADELAERRSSLGRDARIHR